MKAEETMRAVCPIEAPRSSAGRLEAMEKRLDATLVAVKILRPAFEEFYNTLNNDQKFCFDAHSK